MSKKKASDITKKYRTGYWILTVLSWLLTLGPLVGYIIYSFIVSGTIEKVSLATIVFVAIVLTAISIIFKKHIRSTVFLLILGIYLAIEKITVMLIIISICTIIDEFIITPLQKSYHSKLVCNKEIDKRM